MLTDYNHGERKQTNISALYFCIGFVVVLFGFVGITFFNGSIYRVINGIDDCGNICGKENKGNTLNFCGPNDKSNEKFTLVNITQNALKPNVTDIHSKCVKGCEDYPNFVTVVNRCLENKGNSTGSKDDVELSSVIQAVTEDLANSWLSILIICLVALIFSYILLMLFRYAIKYVVWIIYIGLIVVLVLGSIGLLVAYFAASSQGGKEDATGLLVVSGLLGIFAIIAALILYFFRKRIELVIQLFKEASKALVDIPMIIFEPILTFIALMLTFIAFIYFALVIESSGDLKVQNDARGQFVKATYEKGFAAGAAHTINLIAFFWFTSFILGCQHFVIGGTVSQWFFTRSKDKLESPVTKSFTNLCSYHLGSVCLGSMLITIMKIIRMIVEGIKNSLNESGGGFGRAVACCCDCIMQLLEEFLQYLVRNAYIIVAKDGTPLIDSGKRAFDLLKKNLIDVVALNKVGDFVLFMGRIFVVLIAGFVGYEVVMKNSKELNFPAIPIVIGVIFAFLIVHCFVTVYEMTVDTIFICFCEDSEQNNGMDRPYFMSRGLMEVMYELKGASGGQNNGGGQNNYDGQQNIEAGNRPMIPSNWQFSN